MAVIGVAIASACSSEGGSTTGAAPVAERTQVVVTPVVSPTPPGPRLPTVVLDPGHGGEEVGASNHGVVEKASNLDMALRVERLLAAEGVRVILTRRDDRRVAVRPQSAGSSFGAMRFDLQARIDMANVENADLFVSIHSNGNPDAGQRGVEVWYDPNRAFGEENERFAASLQSNVLAELRAYGYEAVDRGIQDDTCFRLRGGRCFTLFLLGSERTTTREEIIRRGGDPEALGMAPHENAITTRATQMPGALVELLFISNATDAVVLRDDGARDAMARGVTAAIIETLAER